METSDPVQNRFVIIIGISEYTDDVKWLPYAANDACRFYTVLKNCGYSEEKMFLLTERKESTGIIYNPPTLNNIFDVIHKVVHVARPTDTIFFYFAGYGIDIFKRPYLLASDSQLDYLLNTAIDLFSLFNLLKQSRAQNILYLLDICRSHFAENRTLQSKLTFEFQDFLTTLPDGQATFCACSANEYAHESSEYKQGIFSYYLNKAIEEGVGIQNEFITLEQVVDYVKQHVLEWTYKRKLKQTPFYSSNLPEDFILSKNTNKKTAIDVIHQKNNFIHSGPEYIQVDMEQDTDYVSTLNSATSRKTEIHTFYDKKILNKKPPVKNGIIQFKKIYELFLKSIDSYIRDFSHPVITIYRTDPVELKVLSNFIYQEFKDFIHHSKIHETIRESRAIQIYFKNAESNEPETSLYVNVVRFASFYWIWYCLPFETLRIQGDFLPLNPLKTDFIALRPPILFNSEKLNLIVSDIFRDCTNTLIDWTQQLHQFQFRKKIK
ncbi:caspase family protein [candidate division KSB1 bacterium]|nr:caspase family protein [candidate division KSB1 bacterium]